MTDSDASRQRLVELSRAQEEAAASRAHYFALFDLAPFGYVLINANGVILEANLAAANLLGVGQRKLIGRSLARFVFSDDRDVFYRHRRRLTGAGMTDGCELRLQRPDGALTWVRLQSALAQSPDGVKTYRVALDDITERKLAEDALRGHVEQLRESLDSLLEGFAIWCAIRDDNDTIADFRLEYINEVGSRSSQKTASELTGHTLSELRPSIKGSSLFRDYAHVVETGQPLVADGLNSEEGWVASERTDRSFDIQASRSGDGFAIVWREVTQRKLAEMRLLLAKEAAEEAKREQQARRQIAERRRLSAESLAKILLALNSNEPFEEVMRFTAGQARQLLGSQAAVVYHTSQEGRLMVAGADGFSSELPAGLGGSQSILMEAIAAHQPVALGTVEPERGGAVGGTLEASDEAKRQWPDSRYRALLAAPIRTKNDTYGAILFCYLQPREFSSDEVDLADDFGRQIALALENARLREELERAAVTAERSRLARDLHDAVTQSLFSVSIMAEALPRVWDRHPEEGRAALEQLRELTRGALAEMRTLLFELRPGVLAEKPMGELLHHLTTAVSRQLQVPIRLSVSGNDALAPNVKTALYRIAQEALNNVARHANARQVEVGLQCQARDVVLRISDDGLGFDAHNTGPGHLGLDIMSERAESIGATLQISAHSGGGTEVIVRYPARDEVPGELKAAEDERENLSA